MTSSARKIKMAYAVYVAVKQSLSPSTRDIINTAENV